SELVQAVRNNLRSDLGHELLHIDTPTIASLRRQCHRHEDFFNNLRVRNNARHTAPRRAVNEINVDEETEENTQESDSPIFAIRNDNQVKCWNCDSVGHRYKDITRTATDIRPFANIILFDQPYLALLDSGANKSVVGGSLAKSIVSGKHKFTRTRGNVRTADGTKQTILEKDTKSRAAIRLRTFWKSKRRYHSYTISSITRTATDIRPFANIILFDQPYLALLDSGANKSVVGGSLAKSIVSGKHKFTRTRGNVRTADGTKQTILGTILVQMTYNSIE
ncbi:hypothetical protein KR084_010681, partial [Drosophila pseudotakahashii]